MALEKSSALILRTVEFSESSLVVTLFTRDFGKIGALAKGARRPKNPFDFALDLLSICRVVFLHKSSSSLDVLTEAKLEHRFRSAGRSLLRFYAGLHLAELLNQFSDYGDPCPPLFEASTTALRQIDGQGCVTSWMVWFEWALLHHIGQQPQFDACAVCGSPLPGESAPLIGLAAGGALCDSCRSGQRHQVRVSRKGAEWLQRISNTVSNPLEAVRVLEHEPAPGEVAALLSGYLRFLAGKPFRTEPFFERSLRTPRR